MITYQQERLANIRPEIEAHVPEQWAEMAAAEGGFDQFVEKPNWDWYLGLEAKGNAVLFTARREGADCELVGWFGVYVYRSTTSDNLMVQATPYYVLPSVGPLRRGLILRNLIRYALDKVTGLPAVGGAMVTIKTHPWASAAPILEHLGFRAVETWYMLPVPPACPAGQAEPSHARDSRRPGPGSA